MFGVRDTTEANVRTRDYCTTSKQGLTGVLGFALSIVLIKQHYNYIPFSSFLPSATSW